MPSLPAVLIVIGVGLLLLAGIYLLALVAEFDDDEVKFWE